MNAVVPTMKPAWALIAAAAATLALGAALCSGCKSTSYTHTAYNAQGQPANSVKVSDKRLFLTSKATINLTVGTNGQPSELSIDVASDPNAAALKSVMDGLGNITGQAVGAAVKAAAKP